MHEFEDQINETELKKINKIMFKEKYRACCE